MGDAEGAGLELRCAREVFERLGARPDIAALDALADSQDAGHAERLSAAYGWDTLTVRGIADEALGHVRDGFRALKLRVGDTWKKDIERVGAVRAAAPGARLIVDAVGDAGPRTFLLALFVITVVFGPMSLP